MARRVVAGAQAMVEYHAHNHRLRGTPRVGKKHSFAPSHKRKHGAGAQLVKSFSTGTPGTDTDSLGARSPTSASIGSVARHPSDSGTSNSNSVAGTSVTAGGGSGSGSAGLSGSSASPSPSPSPPSTSNSDTGGGGPGTWLDATSTAPAQGLRDWVRVTDARGLRLDSGSAGGPPVFVPRIPAPLQSTRSCYSVPSVHSTGPRTPVSPGHLPPTGAPGKADERTPSKPGALPSTPPRVDPGSDCSADGGMDVNVDEALAAAAGAVLAATHAPNSRRGRAGGTDAGIGTADNDEPMPPGAADVSVEVVHRLHDGDFMPQGPGSRLTAAAVADSVGVGSAAAAAGATAQPGTTQVGSRGKYVIPAKRRAMQRAAEAAAAAKAARSAAGIADGSSPRKPAVLSLPTNDAHGTATRRHGTSPSLPPRSPASVSPAPHSPGRGGGVFFATPHGGDVVIPRPRSPLSPGAAVRPPSLPVLATRGALRAAMADGAGVPPPQPPATGATGGKPRAATVVAAGEALVGRQGPAEAAAGVALARPVVRVSGLGGGDAGDAPTSNSPVGGGKGVGLSPTKRARVALSPATLAHGVAAPAGSGGGADASTPSPSSRPPPSGSPPTSPHPRQSLGQGQEGGVASGTAGVLSQGVLPGADAFIGAATGGGAFSNRAWLAAASRAPVPSLTRVASYCAGTGFMGGYSPGRGGQTASTKLLQALVHGGGRANFQLGSLATGNGAHSTGGGAVSDAAAVKEGAPLRRGGSPKARSRTRRHRAFHLTWARSHTDAVHLVQQFMAYFSARLDAEVDVWQSMRRIRSKVLQGGAAVDKGAVEAVE